MKEYIFTLFGVCIISGLVRVLAPEGASSKYLEIICSLCVICVLFAPLAGSLSEFGGIEYFFDENEYENSTNYDEIYNQFITEGQLSELEGMLEKDICEKLSLQENSIAIILDAASEGQKIELVGATAVISAKALSVPPDDVREYIGATLGVDCVIVYGGVG